MKLHKIALCTALLFSANIVQAEAKESTLDEEINFDASKHTALDKPTYPENAPKPLPAPFHPIPIRPKNTSEQTIYENLDLRAEKAKWIYLQEAFGIKLKNRSRLINSLGYLMKEYAIINAIPPTLVCAGIALLVFGGVNAFQVLGNMPRNVAQRQIPNLFMPIFTTLIGTVFTGFIAYVIAYHSCKKIGNWLGTKPVKCKQILASYVSQWNIHKKHTPTLLVPYFERLYADFNMSNGTFNSFTNEHARLFVENALASSIIAQALI